MSQVAEPYIWNDQWKTPGIVLLGSPTDTNYILQVPESGTVGYSFKDQLQ